MADGGTIDEMVVKIGIEVDKEELKKLREEISSLQKKASENAIKLGINKPDRDETVASFNRNARPFRDAVESSSRATSSTTSFVSAPKRTTSNSDDEGDTTSLAEILSLSEKHLYDMLELMKRERLKKERITDAEIVHAKDKSPGMLSKSILDPNASVGALGKTAAGGLGGALEGHAASNIAKGVVGGGILGMLVEALVGILSAGANKVAERIDEDMHFRQLSFQTGMTVDQLYKLQVQAHLAHTSLETFVDSNQRMANELLHGISPEKAQLMMALGVSPQALNIKTGGDPAKINQELFKGFLAGTKHSNPYYRTSIGEMLGFSPEEQDARRRLYDPSIVARAQQTHDIATAHGKTPFVTGKALQAQANLVEGAQADVQASIRSLLTNNTAVTKAAVDLLKVEAATVNLFTKGLNINIKDEIKSAIGSAVKDLTQSIVKGPTDAMKEILGIGSKQVQPASHSATVKSTSY